jgi:hypothetical protein
MQDNKAVTGQETTENQKPSIAELACQLSESSRRWVEAAVADLDRTVSAALAAYESRRQREAIQLGQLSSRIDDLEKSRAASTSQEVGSESASSVRP